MKRLTVCFLLLAMMLCIFGGCKKSDGAEESRLPAQEDPQAKLELLLRYTTGSEKWQTPIDYSNNANWLCNTDEGKKVDVIFFYPTSYVKGAADEHISDIDAETMVEGAQQARRLQAVVFKESCNIYMPYYRQVDTAYSLTMPREDNELLLRHSAAQDPTAALDYYFTHYNNGKPFILAGHSQGAQVVASLLADYMKEHPEYYVNMVAAYVIGYSITEEYLAENPHLRFAEGADDTGVIISFNVEGVNNQGLTNIAVQDGAIAINPINWRRDDTYAPVSENLGSVSKDEKLVEGYADARVDPERGVVICESVEPTEYAVTAPNSNLFGPESYHYYEFRFYFKNLQKNITDRVNAFIRS